MWSTPQFPEPFIWTATIVRNFLFSYIVSIATLFTNYVYIHIKQKGKLILVLLKRLLPPGMNMRCLIHARLTRVTFQKETVRRNLKPSKHTLIDLCGLVCYLEGCSLLHDFVPLNNKPQFRCQYFIFHWHLKNKIKWMDGWIVWIYC